MTDAALRAYDRTTAAMYADRDLFGDTLAVGLAIARTVRDGSVRVVMRDIAAMLGWTFLDGSPNWQRVKWVLGDDRPRYVPREPTGVCYCAAPMIRRDGTCDQRASGGAYLRDEDTGDMTYVPTCARHRSWGINEQHQATVRWQANGAPHPPANTGAVLARYFPMDWAAIYRWGDPAWTPPRETAQDRPRLEVIEGLGEGGGQPAALALT